MIRVDQALLTAFEAGAFDLPVAYENQAFNATSAYAQVLVLQNDVTALTMNNTDQTDGVFRVLLNYPANTGAFAIKSKADEIMKHLRIGKRCHFSGVDVVIIGQQRQPGIAERGWYRVELSFAYQALITRPKE